MLLLRSHNYRVIGVFIFLVLDYSTAYPYEGEYDDEEHSSYSESSEDHRPDYSKYFGGNAQASQLTNTQANAGFVTPNEFASFFSPAFHAATNKQEVTKDVNGGFVKPQEFDSGFADFKASPFGLKDFFEEAAKHQQATINTNNNNNNKAVENEKFEIKPGPSYVSHKVVPPNAKKSSYESEIDDLAKPYNYNTASDTQNEKVIPLYTGGKAKIVDPKYIPQYTAKNPNNLTPYQKYSFQAPGAPTLKPVGAAQLNSLPTGNNYDYLYTPTNNEYKYAYDGDSSNVDEHIDLHKFKPEDIKECKKINKHVPGTSKNAKPMDCYACKDKKGATYEECFYGSESNPKNYYIETSKEYAEPTQVTNFNFNNRYKRYSPTDSGKEDPYEYLKKQNEKYYNDPDFGSSYKAPNIEDEYKHEASSSEKIASELLKSGKNCQKIEKDGMSCLVCKNDKNGGNYEQCSYTTAPEAKKYAYVKERKYNSEDEPEETDSSEEKPVADTKPQQFYQQTTSAPARSERKRGRSRDRDSGSESRKSNQDAEEVERIKPLNTHRHVSEYTVPKHFANIKVQPEKAESEEESTENEDYYYKHFPSESKKQEQRDTPENEEQNEENEEQVEDGEEHYGYYGEESKKDVEEVLAEFAKKDRSKCKKAEKNGMTCYLCVDKKGLQHEECMYVSESRPQSKYHAYHAQQETDGSEGATPATKSSKNNEENAEESKVKSVRASSLEPQTSESRYDDGDEDFVDDDEVTTVAPRKVKRRRSPKTTTEKPFYTKKKSRKHKKSNVDVTTKLDDDPIIEETKDDYRVSGERGAFSDETEPVYSKQYGVSLPKFMLTKSEGELVYDHLAKAKS